MKKILVSVIIIAILLTPSVCMATTDEEVYAEGLVTEMQEEIEVLAKIIYGEANYNHIPRHDKEAVVWVVLNRVDNSQWSNDIIEVATQRHQFAYDKRFPATDEYKAIAKDVLIQWLTNTGEFPRNYFYFVGKRGRNWFTKEYGDGKYFRWENEDEI